MQSHLRIARATNDLKTLAEMYRQGLGFEILGSFEDHDGFDGVMLGHSEGAYHLELTHHRGHVVEGAPTEENLLVFYVPEAKAWKVACEKMAIAGFKQVPAYNPYWDKQGASFEDPDGYRVVLQNAAWG